MAKNELLLFAGGVKREPAIDLWLQGKPGALGAIAATWFAKMRQCGPDVRELLHDGHPTVCVKAAGFAYVNVFTAHVNVGFFQGASLPDPAGLLEGNGKRMRHVKLKPGVAVDSAALGALINAAYADIRQRLRQVQSV